MNRVKQRILSAERDGCKNCGLFWGGGIGVGVGGAQGHTIDHKVLFIL